MPKPSAVTTLPDRRRHRRRSHRPRPHCLRSHHLLPLLPLLRRRKDGDRRCFLPRLRRRCCQPSTREFKQAGMLVFSFPFKNQEKTGIVHYCLPNKNVLFVHGMGRDEGRLLLEEEHAETCMYVRARMKSCFTWGRRRCSYRCPRPRRWLQGCLSPPSMGRCPWLDYEEPAAGRRCIIP